MPPKNNFKVEDALGKVFALALDCAFANWDFQACRATFVHLSLLREAVKQFYEQGPQSREENVWSEDEELSFRYFFADICVDIEWERVEKKTRGYEIKITKKKYEEASEAQLGTKFACIDFHHNIFQDADVLKTQKHTDIMREAVHMTSELMTVTKLEELRAQRNENGRCIYLDSPQFDIVPYQDWESEKAAALPEAKWLAKDPIARVFIHDPELATLLGRDAQGRKEGETFSEVRAAELAIEFDALPEFTQPVSERKTTDANGPHPASTPAKENASKQEMERQATQWKLACKRMEHEYGKPKGYPIITALRNSGHVRVLALGNLIRKGFWMPEIDWVDTYQASESVQKARK